MPMVHFTLTPSLVKMKCYMFHYFTAIAYWHSLKGLVESKRSRLSCLNETVAAMDLTRSVKVIIVVLIMLLQFPDL